MKRKQVYTQARKAVSHEVEKLKGEISLLQERLKKLSCAEESLQELCVANGEAAPDEKVPASEEIFRILSEHGSPMSTKEIIVEFRRAREHLYSSPMSMKGTISAALSRNSKIFRNVGRGVWDLVQR